MDAYARLISLLAENGVPHRGIDHAPEGQTDLVSAMRGHDVRLAAKCLVLIVKVGKKTTKFVLAVVPGDRKVDMKAIKQIFSATYAGFASTADAERLSGCVAGTVLPFSFSDDLPVVADSTLFDAADMYFNAGRLDRSVVIGTADYLRLQAPRVERIAAAAESEVVSNSVGTAKAESSGARVSGHEGTVD
jgi:Ala-tRNA(Pro) deacylase